MKQFSALALAAALALPGATAFANEHEIAPIVLIPGGESDFAKLANEPDGYEAAVAGGVAIIVGGIVIFTNEDDGDSSNGTNNTTGTN